MKQESRKIFAEMTAREFATLKREVVNRLYGRFDNYDMIEEAFSEACVSASKSNPDDIRNMEAYFCEVTKRKYIDMWRSATRKREIQAGTGFEIDAPVTSVTNYNIENALIDRESARRFLISLHNADSLTQKIIRLRLKNMTLEKIGHAVGGMNFRRIQERIKHFEKQSGFSLNDCHRRHSRAAIPSSQPAEPA